MLDHCHIKNSTNIYWINNTKIKITLIATTFEIDLFLFKNGYTCYTSCINVENIINLKVKCLRACNGSYWTDYIKAESRRD